MITIVIDGYNVMHAIPEFSEIMLKKNFKDARAYFIGRCSRYAKTRKDISRILIIFDGRASFDSNMHDADGVKIIFSKERKGADETIIEILKKNQPARDFVVVTRDNYIMNHCRIYSAMAISPEIFGQEVEKRDKCKRDKETLPDPQKFVKSQGDSITEWYRDELKKSGAFWKKEN